MKRILSVLLLALPVVAQTVQPIKTVYLLHGIGQDKTAMSSLKVNLSNPASSNALDLLKFKVDSDFDFGDCSVPPGSQVKSTNPFDAGQWCSLELGAKRLANYIRTTAPAGNEIVLVGYSQGGLVARTMIANGYLPEYYVSTLITLGTPNLGYPYNGADSLARPDALASEMYGDFSSINPLPGSGPYVPTLAPEARGVCTRYTTEGKQIRMSTFLCNLNDRWGNLAAPSRPRKWLAAAGRLSNQPYRNLGYLSAYDGCSTGWWEDGVVCEESALMHSYQLPVQPTLNALGTWDIPLTTPSYASSANTLGFVGPDEKWTDPNNQFSHIDNWKSWFLFAGNPGGSHQALFNPLPGSGLYEKIVSVISADAYPSSTVGPTLPVFTGSAFGLTFTQVAMTGSPDIRVNGTNSIIATLPPGSIAHWQAVSSAVNRGNNFDLSAQVLQTGGGSNDPRVWLGLAQSGSQNGYVNLEVDASTFYSVWSQPSYNASVGAGVATKGITQTLALSRRGSSVSYLLGNSTQYTKTDYADPSVNPVVYFRLENRSTTVATIQISNLSATTPNAPPPTPLTISNVTASPQPVAVGLNRISIDGSGITANTIVELTGPFCTPVPCVANANKTWSPSNVTVDAVISNPGGFTVKLHDGARFSDGWPLQVLAGDQPFTGFAFGQSFSSFVGTPTAPAVLRADGTLLASPQAGQWSFWKTTNMPLADNWRIRGRVSVACPSRCLVWLGAIGQNTSTGTAYLNADGTSAWALGAVQQQFPNTIPQNGTPVDFAITRNGSVLSYFLNGQVVAQTSGYSQSQNLDAYIGFENRGTGTGAIQLSNVIIEPYVPAPTLTSIDGSQLRASQLTPISAVGSGFDSQVVLDFDASGVCSGFACSIPNGNVNARSATSIQALANVAAGTYNVRARNAGGQVSNSLPVTVLNAISGSCNINPNPVPYNQGATIYGSASGGTGTGYQYSFNGNPFSVASSVAILPNPGTYTATLQVKDSAGNTASTSCTAQVQSAPPVTASCSISPNPVPYNQGATIYGSASGGTGTGYQYSFNGNPFSVASSVAILPSPGTYTATLQVKDSAGSTASASCSAQVNSPPPFTLNSSSPGTVAAASTFTLTVSGTGFTFGTVTAQLCGNTSGFCGNVPVTIDSDLQLRLINVRWNTREGVTGTLTRSDGRIIYIGFTAQ